VRLFELFARTPRTAKQAAEHLGLPPTRLYHHVAALERVGLVRLVETRKKRGTVEKYFRAVPLRLGAAAAPAEATHGRGSGVAADALVLAALLLERARADCLVARATPRPRGRPLPAPVAARVGYHFDPARLPRVRQLLLAFLKRLRALSTRTGTAPRWMLTLALVPTTDVSAAPARKRARGPSTRTLRRRD